MKYKEMRKYHTRDGFHYKDNYADLSLFQDNVKVLNEKARMLSPLKYGASSNYHFLFLSSKKYIK